MPPAEHRPVFLNLFRIRLPVMGVVSIVHRLTGVVLFLAMPAAVWLLETSLRDAAGFEWVRAQLAGPLGWLLPFIVWALAHHTLAGIRVLLLDMDRGVDLATARGSALLVLAGGALVFLLAWVVIA